MFCAFSLLTICGLLLVSYLIFRNLNVQMVHKVFTDLPFIVEIVHIVLHLCRFQEGTRHFASLYILFQAR